MWRCPLYLQPTSQTIHGDASLWSGVVVVEHFLLWGFNKDTVLWKREGFFILGFFFGENEIGKKVWTTPSLIETYLIYSGWSDHYSLLSGVPISSVSQHRWKIYSDSLRTTQPLSRSWKSNLMTSLIYLPWRIAISLLPKKLPSIVVPLSDASCLEIPHRKVCN